MKTYKVIIAEEQIVFNEYIVKAESHSDIHAMGADEIVNNGSFYDHHSMIEPKHPEREIKNIFDWVAMDPFEKI